MKKQEMINTLTKQGENIRKEIVEMQQSFNTKKELLIRIEGALEALNALEDETPVTDTVDHTDAAAALGILK